MRLNRLVVEEGFLGGIDIEFRLGLNVLIGARGSGKTSVIELIRFALGLEPLTARAKTASEEHVRSVLGSGRVTVELDADGVPITVVRAVDDPQPRASSALLALPIILGQNEIESVAVDAAGRLRLIDGFVIAPRPRGKGESALLAQIGSASKDIANLVKKIAEIADRAESLKGVPDQLSAAKKAEQALVGDATQGQRLQRLEELSKQIATLSVEANSLEITAEAAKQYFASVRDLAARPPRIATWSSPRPEPSEMRRLREVLAETGSGLEDLASKVSSAASEIDAAITRLQEALPKLEDQARKLRHESETATAGAGAAARTTAELQKKEAERAAAEKQLLERQAELIALQQQRDQLLDRLDEMREERYRRRESTAKELNARLRPHVEVDVERYGSTSEYASNLAAALRGSQIHYSALAPQIAAALSPRELVSLVESNDVERFVSLTSIASDRAAKVLSHLHDSSLGALLTTSLEDSVDLKLLVGSELRPTDHLSTGQRCTVVLPILLAHEDRVLVVDQPEDHLDNAYVAATVVPAIADRPATSQLLLATHNANIPVLGNAAQVVCMGSDGKRGFVRLSGSLDEPEVVEVITTLMEGGREAFERRARFYQQH